MDDDSYAAVDENGNSYSNGNYKQSSSSDDAVYSALGDIPEFTSRIWYGYQLYSETLSKLLPPQQQPILVPSALAFLLIYAIGPRASNQFQIAILLADSAEL